MKYYDCKISFQSLCNEDDLKIDNEYIYNLIKKNFWNTYNVKFTYKKARKFINSELSND